MGGDGVREDGPEHGPDEETFAKWARRLSLGMALFFSLCAVLLLTSEIIVTLAHQVRHLTGALEGEHGTHVEVWGLGAAFFYSVLLGLVGAAFSVGVPGSTGQRLLSALVGKLGGGQRRMSDDTGGV